MITAGLLIVAAAFLMTVGALGNLSDAIVEVNKGKYQRATKAVGLMMIFFMIGMALIVAGVNR